MNSEIQAYNDKQAPADKEICDLLASTIDSELNEAENKIHIDASVKIGNYDMKFKATGYKTANESLFSVIIYDRLYELSGNAIGSEDFKWQFTEENLLPEDLASLIGKEIQKQSKETQTA